MDCMFISVMCLYVYIHYSFCVCAEEEMRYKLCVIFVWIATGDVELFREDC